MGAVTYALADFVTGGPIIDLPVKKGAPWTVALNRADSLECTINMRDADNRGLDLRSATEPEKTILLARNEADVVIAWGIIKPTREWDEDKQTLKIEASGVRDEYFGQTIIAPASALSAALTVSGKPNPALDTTLTNYSLGTIGKKLVEQRLAFPGAPVPFILPPDEIGTHERTYPFPAFTTIGEALDDLADVEGGPDFAFDAQRAPDGLSLLYVMRHGSEAEPRIGTHVGQWSLGGTASPISGFKLGDAGEGIATAIWFSAGKQSGDVLLARALNEALITEAGYPPLDLVDTTRNTVSKQSTLNAYANEARDFVSRGRRELSFNVRADARPGLGEVRPGDTVDIGIPAGHAWIADRTITVRITSISGDEVGKVMKIGCVILGE